ARDSFQLAPDAGLPCERFNDANAQKEPLRLAVEFSGPLDLAIEEIDETTQYGTWRYEVTISNAGGRYIVGSETLKQKPDGKGKWIRVFDRQGESVKGGKAFGLGGYSNVIDKVRDNA